MSQTTLKSNAVKNSKPRRSKVELTLSSQSKTLSKPRKGRKIWWSNAIFFSAFHIVGLSGWYYWPSTWRTWLLCYMNWQIGTLGITIGNDSQLPKLMLGYHRLWSHRSFTVKLPLRIILAAMGTLGFQGSIRYHDFVTS